MSTLTFIEGFRKLRSFLAAVFPGLWRALEMLLSPLAKAGRHPRTIRLLERVRATRLGRTAEYIWRNFYWKDHAKYAPDAVRLPADAIAILRPIFITAVALCLLMPLTLKFPGMTLAAEGIEHANTPVAVWSVILWIISQALAWGCLLVGTASSNRPALLLSVVLFIYFAGVAAMGLPRSAWNALVPLVAITAMACGEFCFGQRARRDVTAAIVLFLGGGMASGIALISLTPLARVFSGHVLAAGAGAGVLIGGIAFAAARLARRKIERDGSLILPGFGVHRGEIQPAVNLSVPPPATLLETKTEHPNPAFPTAGLFALLTGLCLLHSAILAARGGLSRQAGATLDFLYVWTGYLWPLYYFIGAGVVFKLLGRSRDVVQVFRNFMPDKPFVVLTSVGFFIAALIAWLPFVLEVPGLDWPNWMVRAAEWVYRLTASIIWEHPIFSETWTWVRWFLLIDVAIILLLLARRRLDNKAADTLLFATLLASLITFELIFQQMGFARTGTHSILVLTTFSVGILWVVHRTALRFISRSTIHWPQLGRLGIYGSLVLFVLLSLHARTAIGDTKVMVEIFLYFFSGLIGIGIPYYLYIIANRSLKEMPVSLPRIFTAYCIGAAFALPVVALDKLAAAGGSLSVLLTELDRERNLLLAGIMRQGGPTLPAYWLAGRGLLFLCILGFFGFLLLRRRAEDSRNRAAVMLGLISSAMGFASFSGMKVDWPLLPTKAVLLLTPLNVSTAMDVGLIAIYLAYGIPALILVLCITRSGRVGLGRWIAGSALAYPFYLLIMLTWPDREPWIRSSNLLATAGIGALLLFLILLMAAHARVQILTSADAAGSAARQTILEQYIGKQALKWLGIGMLIALICGALLQINAARFLDRPVPGFSHSIPVPAQWLPASSEGLSMTFARSTLQRRSPTLVLGKYGKPDPAQRPQEMLQGSVRTAATRLPGFMAGKIQDWNRYFPGARAIDFSYEAPAAAGESLLLVGRSVVLPLRHEGPMMLTLTGIFSDWINQQWELARIAQELNRRGY